MTDVETVETKDQAIEGPPKGVIVIKAAFFGFFLLVFFPTMLITFAGFLLTHDLVWLESALVFLKYSIVGFVSILVLLCVIGGVYQVYRVFYVLRAKK